MTRITCVQAVSRVTRILSMEGLLPSRTVRRKMNIVKLILHTLLFATILFLILMNGINAIKRHNNKVLIHMTCILMPIVNLLMKVIVILQKRRNFVSLLDYLKSDVFNSHSDELNGYVRFVYRISEMMWKYYIVVIAVYMSVAVVSPVLDAQTIAVPPPFDMGRYLIIYKLVHALLCIYFGLNSICSDVLFMSLLGICIAQLHILEKRLMHVFEEAEKICENRDPKETYLYEEEVLRVCLVLHDSLSQYVDELNVILSFPLFVQYFCGCFIICNLVLQLTIMGERSTGNILTIIAYACVTFSQMAVYHWLGNEIIFMSENIVDACYLSQWYKLHRRSKKILMILMERAKRPLAVQLYKLIVRWSYSLFALIKGRYN